MLDVVGKSDLTPIKKFYKEHINQGRNLSFSALFLIQPDGGNGLPKLTMQDLKTATLDATTIDEAVELFTQLCVELYPGLSLPQRKNFVTMLNALKNDRLLTNTSDVDELKKTIVHAMQAHYQEQRDVMTLPLLSQDFPDCFEEQMRRVQEKGAQETATVLEEESIPVEMKITSEEAVKSLASKLILQSSSMSIGAFKQEFMKLEGSAISSLRSIALLLLTRYFYAANIQVGESKPSWSYLVDTYQISLHELVEMAIKKYTKDAWYFEDNIKRLVGSFSPEQWREDAVATTWIKKVYAEVFAEGEHSVCSFLQEKLPFLLDDPYIAQRSQYVAGDNTSVPPLRKPSQVGMSQKESSRYIQEKRARHVSQLNTLLREGTSEGVKKAVGYIDALSGDDQMSSYLWKMFISTTTAEGYNSVDALREAVSATETFGCSDLGLTTRFIDQLLLEGQSHAELLQEVHEFIGSQKVSAEYVVGRIHKLIIDPLLHQNNEQTTYVFPEGLVAFLRSTDFFDEATIVDLCIKIIARQNAKRCDRETYFGHPKLFADIKTALVQNTELLDEEGLLANLKKVIVHDPESNFIRADLFYDEYIKTDTEALQSYFDAYVDHLVSECSYEGVVSLLEGVATRYTYDRVAIIKRLISRIFELKQYDKVDSIIESEGLKGLLDEHMQKEKFFDKIKNKSLVEFIADDDVHEACKSPEVLDDIQRKVEKIDVNNRSHKEVRLRPFLDVITPIFLGIKADYYDEALKNILAKKAIEGFESRSSVDPKYADLYACLQLEYSGNLKSINHLNHKIYRKKRQEAQKKISSLINMYPDVLNWIHNEVIAPCKKKAETCQTDEERDARQKACDEWSEIATQIPSYEYSLILNHLTTSINRIQHNQPPIERRPHYSQYGQSYQDDSTTYYGRDEVVAVCTDLIEKKLGNVPQAEQRSLRNKTLQQWFLFYEATSDYEGITMLERVYGFSIDRIQEQKKALHSFLQEGNKEKIEQLTELIAMFGMSNAADILYQLYPEYKGLPQEDIEGILSQYLGDLLLRHTGIGLHHIPERLDISGVGLMDSLFTVIERDFVRVFTETKKTHHDWSNADICQHYLQTLHGKFDAVKGNHPKLHDVYTHFAAFLETVLAVEKPENFVDHLVEGREFPDFLQRLNAALICDKKRFLVADGMGLGKSLSAILAKEHSEAKSCLVVVPSLVTGTRQGYLSDINDPATKKRGYYKPGKAPSVYVINSPADIVHMKDATYDYVIISQEKLQGDEYVEALIAQGFDFMIVDEVHKLKNLSDGKRANGLLRVTQYVEEKGGNLCLLSGTPIPNKVGDIAILLKLLYPEKYATIENDVLVKSIIKGGDLLNLRSLLLPMMQMKKLTDHVDMPELMESVKYISLSNEERLYYDAFIEDATMTGQEKLIMLRKFLLNPQLVGVPIERFSKAKQIGEDANELFKTKSKIVLFANGFISGVLRDKEGVDTTFIEQMQLDPDIEVRVIDGTNTADRQRIQDEFNSSNKKVALFINGATADVGIDLTAGEHIMHINGPRTQADADQQVARVYRYGQDKDIESTKYIMQGTIEHGIDKYVAMKHDIIRKLYYGLKLSDLERRVITEAEGESIAKKSSSSVNTALTTYIRSAKDKLNSMWGYLREGGVEKVEELVASKGKEMAEYYALLGPRSYQANVNRWHATLLSKIVKSATLSGDMKIIDLGSGPRMLEQHADKDIADSIVNVDINPHHFTEEEVASGKAVVADFANLPFDAGSVDVVNSSLSFNETAWSRSQKEYERLDVLLEMHRVLKEGGIAIISTIYSLQYKYPESLHKLLNEMGFEIVPEYTGKVVGSEAVSFEAKTLVLRKKSSLQSRYYWTASQQRNELIGSQYLNGLDMVNDPVSLSSQEYVLDTIEMIPSISGSQATTTDIRLNTLGERIKDTERNYKNLVAKMQLTDGVEHIADISDMTLRKRGFGRYMNASSCVIMVRLPNNAGLFRYSMPLKKG